MNSTYPPAQLFTGSASLLEKESIAFLQSHFCLDKGCGSCNDCIQIQNYNHYACTWIEPEKRYTLDTIEIIFKKTTFALDDGEHAFFIIKKTDFLTPACANSILKIVEEPPQGYHFIFLAERLSPVLPTIRSRCIHKSVGVAERINDFPPLLQHFMKLDPDPLIFNKDLFKLSMTEQECLMYLDDLIGYWITVYKRALKDTNNKLKDNSLHMINQLKKFILIPPAPGSAKVFWKNVFLQVSKKPFI